MRVLIFIPLLLLCGCDPTPPASVEPAQAPDLEPVSDTETEVCIEEQDKSVVITEQARLIGQLAAGMRRIVTKRDRGHWYRCGELLTAEEQIEESTSIAWRVVQEMAATGLDDTVSPWGVLGTIYNESGFDPCALGLYPRKWAYEEGLLERRRKTRSHSRAEVLDVVHDPSATKQFKSSGFDLGLCQVLSRFYRETDLEEMLTVKGGLRICILEMQARARRHKTETPWTFWKGTETGWYEAKINRWVRIMKG